MAGRRSSEPGGGDDTGVPVPKLTARNLRGKSGRRAWVRKPPGKVAKTFAWLGAAVFFAIVILGFVAETAALPYRAGWSGVPGTVSTVLCVTEGSGRSSHLTCTGVFQPTDRNAGSALVTIEGQNSFAGDRAYPARLHPDGQTVSVAEPMTVAYVLAGMSALLALVALVGGYVGYLFAGLVLRRLGRAWQPTKIVVLLPMIVAGALFLMAIAGVVVGANVGS